MAALDVALMIAEYHDVILLSPQSSPAPLCAYGRTPDIDAILHVINTAQQYVHIAVMDYFPTTLYRKPNE